MCAFHLGSIGMSFYENLQVEYSSLLHMVISGLQYQCAEDVFIVTVNDVGAKLRQFYCIINPQSFLAFKELTNRVTFRSYKRHSSLACLLNCSRRQGSIRQES